MSGPAPVPPTPPPQPARMAPRQDNTLAVLSCLLPLLCIFGGVGLFAFLPPLIIWQANKDKDVFVAETAREIFNVQLSLLIYGFGLFLGVGILGLLAFGMAQGGSVGPEGFSVILLMFLPIIPAMFLLFLYEMVVCILAAIRASNGDIYRAPLILRLF